MKQTIEENGQELVVTLEGEFDLYSSVDLRKILLKRMDENPVNLTLDCSRVDYIDSSGIGLLMQLFNLSKKKGTSLKIRGLSESIMNLFRAIRLDKALGDVIVTDNTTK